MERVIQIDSREQKNSHIERCFAENGIRFVRSKLFCGDYASLHDQAVVVDKKYGLAEVAQNLVQGHDRFRDECIRASENGIRLVVLIEEAKVKTLADVAKWQNPRTARWCQLRAAQEKGKALNIPLGAPPINGERLMKAMETMSERYGVEWRFCEKSQTGNEIVRILFGDKELEVSP